MDFVSLVPLLFLAAVVFFVFRRAARQGAKVNQRLKQETREALEIVMNPDTDLSVLRQYLVMPIPHDATYEYHMEILRALSANPSLPPELQAAAVNRISNEEVSARLDKTLKKRGSSGSKGFMGFSQEISGE